MDDDAGSRNAVVALKPEIEARRSPIRRGSRNAVVTLKRRPAESA